MSLPSGWPAIPIAGSGHPGRRVQYAALPYRVRRDGEVQIRLITSRETRRWVIPKGWPIKGLTPPKTAARESYEEAGLMGAVGREPIGMYTYEKRLGTRTVLCDVLVFPLKVKRLLQKWPERFQRYGFWFSIDSAAGAVQEEELSELIRAFGALMARKQEAKLRAAEEKAARDKAGKARPDKASEAKPAQGPEAAVAGPAGKAGAGEAPAGKSASGESASGKAATGKAATGKIATGKSAEKTAPEKAVPGKRETVKAAKKTPAADAAQAGGDTERGNAASDAPEPGTLPGASPERPATEEKTARERKKAAAAKPKRKTAAAPEDGPSGPA